MRTNNRKKGFTLIETLVAIGLFSIVIAIAVGGFVRALKTQSQIVALVSANSNASLIIEQMAREIRTGIDFACAPSVDICSTLSFTNSGGNQVSYYAGDGKIWKTDSGGDGTAKVITAENIRVSYMKFRLEQDANWQPRITVSLGITPAAKFGDLSVTEIQTTVSSR